MDTTTYVALSQQLVLERDLDVTANNLANMNTTAFKLETLMMQTDPVDLPSKGGGPPQVNFVLDGGVARDFSAGSMKETDGPFDLAIQGDGFFTINTPAGPRYTRDGRFSLNDQGQLVTRNGDPVDGGGGPITIDPTKGPVHIAGDGTISQSTITGAQTVGKISVVSFASLSGLSKEGNGLYNNVSNVQPQPSTTAALHQGMLESSNVEPMSQMIHLVRVTAAYTTISEMLVNISNMSRTAVDRLGQVT